MIKIKFIKPISPTKFIKPVRNTQPKRGYPCRIDDYEPSWARQEREAREREECRQFHEERNKKIKKTELDLCTVRSLLWKHKGNLDKYLTEEERKVLRYQFEEHREHRIEDLKAEKEQLVASLETITKDIKQKSDNIDEFDEMCKRMTLEKQKRHNDGQNEIKKMESEKQKYIGKLAEIEKMQKSGDFMVR